MNKTILLVEDTPDLRENLTAFLEMEDFAVEQSANGAVALKKLETLLPDLIITDLVMPELDGVEFIIKMKEDPRLSQIPIIVFSAKPPHEAENKVLSLGANRYIKKPSTVDMILQTVNELLA
ncbi:MAG: response regulator [Bacteroidia bacterium]|nr:response regulator [Bacteroidia bacterium]